MEKLNSNIFSQSNSLRLYILENTMYVEELVSATIGFLLDIDWEKSKSFGFSSSALSFNQKILIIQDIGNSSERIDKKTNILMRIRNKFAHIKSIDSFEKLFEIDNGNELKKGLDFYASESYTFSNDEERYKLYFFLLIREIVIIINEIINEHLISISKKAREILTNTFVLDIKAEMKKLDRFPKIN